MGNAQEITRDSEIPKTELDSVVVRFAGDSGDGVQLTGLQFTHETALAGNDMATLPNFPAEIRAPAGTLAGVSGFQIQFGSQDIFTPGDAPDVLVALNPAALKANLKELKPGGILILNEDAFNDKNLARVNYTSNPIQDEDLKKKYQVYVVPITKLTQEALKDSGLTSREVDRCKNFFTLGVMLWIFNRPHEHSIHEIEQKFKKSPELRDANIKALKAGLTFAEVTEIFHASYTVRPAKLAPGTYKNINGTTATAYGLISAALNSGLPMFFGAYPITPASELLHELAKQKALGISTFQAEDEIAAICAAIGAAYAGSLAITSSSGPGIALKTEALTLAVCAELPLVVVNTQRAGPATGLPTKIEQADLYQALHGRAGEAPLCVIAASSPATAFELAYEACRIAVKYMTPVVFMSDGYIANNAAPWKIADPEQLKAFDCSFARENNNKNGGDFLPYLRNEQTLARPWAVPGTPGLMHRIGGLEKENITGMVNYDGDNHALMTKLRAEKIERIAQEIPPTAVDGPQQGDLLVIGWGSTEGAITKAVLEAREAGLNVARAHVHFLNPLPPDLGAILKRYKRVLVPEINSGQFRSVLRDKFLVDAQGLNVIKGQPLKVSEILDAIKKLAQVH